MKNERIEFSARIAISGLTESEVTEAIEDRAWSSEGWTVEAEGGKVWMGTPMMDISDMDFMTALVDDLAESGAKFDAANGFEMSIAAVDEDGNETPLEIPGRVEAMATAMRKSTMRIEKRYTSKVELLSKMAMSLACTEEARG